MTNQNHNEHPVPFNQTDVTGGLEIIPHGRKLHTYTVTDQELDALQQSGLSTTKDLAFFSLCIGIFVSAIVTLSTVDIINTKIFASYISIIFISGIASLWFGLGAFNAYKNAKNRLNEIKGRS